ncbi:Hypothetical predicted protein, partial [Paramuricea clavata]
TKITLHNTYITYSLTSTTLKMHGHWSADFRRSYIVVSSDIIRNLKKHTELKLAACPWLNSELKYLMINRDKLKKKAISSNNSESLSAYKQQRNFVNNKIRKAKKAYFQDELNRNARVQVCHVAIWNRSKHRRKLNLGKPCGEYSLKSIPKNK